MTMPTPKTDPEANGSGKKTKKRMPLRHLVLTLFMQPQVLMVLAHDKLRRAIFYVLLVGLVCGGILGVMRAIPLHGRVRDWAEWFERHTESLTLADGGRLDWGAPDEVPATLYHGRTRVDFMPAEASHEAFEPLGEDDRGLWITPVAVYWWVRSPGDGTRVYQPLLVDGKLFGRVSVESVWPDGFELRGAAYSERIESWAMATVIPGVVVAEILRVVATTFFYTFIFAIVPYLLRSPLAARGFGGVFTFYLYAGIVPLIVATVYSSVAPYWMTFDSFFVMAFIFYLLLTMWKVRRAFQSKG